MKNKKGYWIVLLTIAALLLDLVGRVLADQFVLPLWCDSIGTFLIAYLGGPVCGAVVGFSNNIIYGIFVDRQTVYCIVGALIGIAVGYFSKKNVFDREFTTMTLGMGLAVFSTIVAVLISTLLYNGMSGNVWGNQVMMMCMDKGVPRYVSYVIGQFCVEFLDKLVSVEIVYLLLKGVRCMRRGSKKNLQAAAKLMLLILAVSGCFGSIDTVNAQETTIDYDSYVQKIYSKEEGLISGEANDIAQTKDGKLWIATYAGLFKYDGAKFVYLQDISSAKTVNCLYVDEEGRLWAGTNDSGVTIFINEEPINVVDDQNGLLSNSVKQIVCDSLGNYYIGTAEGLSVVSLSGGVKVTGSLDQIKNVVSMTADDNGNVAGVTERGDVFWINNGKQIPAPEGIEPDACYKSAFFSQDGQLYLGTTDNKVYVYTMKSGKPVLESRIVMDGCETINCFYQTESGELFVCSDTGVALIDKGGRCQSINTNNFNSSIDNMLMDYQGNLWFSSSRLGLLEMCQSPFEELFPKIGQNVVVNTTAKWDGLLFCGTDSGLIVIDDKKEVSNTLTELLQGVRVRCLKVDSTNALWIATTEKGVYKVTAKNHGGYHIKSFTEENGMPGMRFQTIIECSDGKIMAAGDYGVAVLSKDSVVSILDAKRGLANEKSLCLLEYQDACYVGSDGGGITRIDKDNHVSSITKKNGLSSDVVLRMVYDPIQAGVFIVTSNGLCYLSADGKVTILDQFPYSNNYDLICNSDGTCWILSSAGIYVASAKDLVKNVRTEYPLINSKRGFRASLVANSWIGRENDDLYLCCDTGVVKVNMTKYDMTTKSYRMILNSVKVDGKSMEINRVDPFQLSADAHQITFSPEVLNYSMDDPYVRVKLEGCDKSERVCRLSELNSITYTNLKQGQYVFEIAILDDVNGNVIEAGRYVIEKDIEMYQNWWFKLYVCLIAGLVLMWITWFITRSKMQRTLLKQKLELEYAKKQIQMSNETILSIARTVDAKDSNTSQHSYRVSEYSVAIAKRLGYSEEQCENLRKMALLHDIGKIGIPDAILNKPARLTDEEYEIMKTHVIRGGEILKDFTLIDNVGVGALYHHERYDGTGYCHGLKGEEIPIEARIIGIADAFDAMTANRVYRKQLDLDFVIGELKRCSGTQFDPHLVEIMLSLIEEGVIDAERLYAKAKGEQKE